MSVKRILFIAAMLVAVFSTSAMAAIVHVNDFKVAILSIGPTDSLDLLYLNSYGIVSATEISPVPTSYSTIYSYVQNGCNGGSWDGVGGISSSAAAANPEIYGLALISGQDYLDYTGQSTFFGHSVQPNDSLIRCTQYGDANLDGMVDSNDYALIDWAYYAGGSAAGYSGWIWGDFNYDGSINEVDYYLMNYSVPEPTTIAMLFSVALGGFLLYRRRS